MSFPSWKSNLLLGSISHLEVLLVFSVTLIAILLVRLCKAVTRTFFSPLRALPGPNASFFYGNMKDRLKFNHGVWYEQMLQTYGPVFTYGEAMGVSELHHRVFLVKSVFIDF